MCRKTPLAHSGAQDEYQVSVSAPLGLGLEDDHRLQHGQRRRVGRRLGPAGLSQHVGHLRELLDDSVRDLQQFLGFGDGDARHGRWHVEDGALLQGRHEFRAELEIDRDSGDHQDQRNRDHQPPPAQGPDRHRLVHPHQ